MGARPPSEKLVLGLMLGRIRDDPFNGIQDRMGFDPDRMFDEAGEEKVAVAPRAEDSIWFDRLLLGMMLNRISGRRRTPSGSTGCSGRAVC